MTFLGSRGLNDLVKEEYSNPDAGGSPAEGGSPPGVVGPGAEPQPPAGGSPVESTINLKEFLDGKIQNPDELKGIVERGFQFSTETEQELNTLRQQREQFSTIEEREKKIKEFNPYKDARFYKLERIIESEPDNSELYTRLVFGGMADIDLVKTELKSKHPDIFKDNPDALQSALEIEFPALFDETIPHDSKEYKDSMLKLQMRASTIRKEYQGKLDSIAVPDPKAEAEKRVRDTENLKTAWKPKLEKLKSELAKLPVEVSGEKDGDADQLFFDIDIPDADRKELLTFAENYIIQNQIPLTDESAKAVADHAKMLWIVQNISKYNALIAEKASRSANGEWRRTIHNSRRPGESSGPAETLEDAADVIFNHLKKQGTNYKF